MARSSRAGGAIGSDDYTGFSLILIVVGLCILGWASWQVWHAQISRIALLVAHYEMEAIGAVTDRFRPADIAVQRAHPDRVQFGQLVRLYRNIGQEFVYPAMALVLALAGLCFLRAGNARFTRTFDLEKLMAEQAIHSRSTAAFVGRGLNFRSCAPASRVRPTPRCMWMSGSRATRRARRAVSTRRRPAASSCASWAGGGRGPPRLRARALHARGLRLAGRPAPRRSGRAAWTPVGGVAARQSRRRGRAGRAARLRSEDASPSPIACSRRWMSPPGPSTSWRSIILPRQASCRS